MEKECKKPESLVRASNFAKVRKERGLRQIDVANAIGMSRSLYGRKETQARTFTVDELYKLAKFYEMSMEELAFGKM